MEDTTHVPPIETPAQPLSAQVPPVNERPTSNTQPLPPDNYLVWSILATILCCWPFGIPAIVYSSKVDRYWASGYYDLAKDASAKAKKWTIISAIVAAVCWVLYCVLLVILISLGLWSI